MSHYWKGYRRGWYKGFVIGIVFTVILYSLFIVYWVGMQNIFK